MFAFEAVIDAVADGVLLTDFEGTILQFNPACEAIFGYSRAEVAGKNIGLLLASPVAGNPAELGVRHELAGLRKDGTPFPMDISVSAAGESIFVATVHDLSGKTGPESSQVESAAQLRSVVDTAVDGVLLISAAGIIQMFNPACERLFGYTREEAIGRDVRMLIPTSLDHEPVAHLRNYREITGRTKAGSTFPMELSVGEAEQDGEVVFVAVVHDLTERMRSNDRLLQAQKMEIVGQLSGGIAHDFNNLLTVIMGHSELLGEKLRARPDLKQYCDTVIGAAERGADLTRRLLAFSRKQTLQPAAINANRLIESMRPILRRTLREDIETEMAFDDQLVPAFADAAQLESAVLNLAVNAQDAMPEGGTLHIRTSNAVLEDRYHDSNLEMKPGAYVLISVTDNGAGMPHEVAERAFEPFFTTKEVGKGNGLGLSMVYGFIKQSNGHVAIYSEPGLGTTVKLYLPAAYPASSIPEAEEAQPDVPHGSGTVLVVEDDPFVRGYAVGCIEGLGYSVVTAANGPEAITRLSALGEKIDLLFSDIVMPGGIGGRDLAERACEMRPGLKVLLTSGYQIDAIGGRAGLSENMTILHKPYRKADLGRRISELLQ